VSFEASDRDVGVTMLSFETTLNSPTFPRGVVLFISEKPGC